MNPTVIIDVKKFKHNVDTLTRMGRDKGVSIMGVSKVFLAAEPLLHVYEQSDLTYIADSRIENLQHVEGKTKVLLRLPSISEASKVAKIADISLNSELETLVALNKAAKKRNVKHGILLMIDIGDLREGIYDPKEMIATIDVLLTLEYLDFVGIGTNLTCYGGVIPNHLTWEKLLAIKHKVETHIQKPLNLISGGNSSSIPELLLNKMPPEINNLRIGEAFVLGRETAYGEPIPGLYTDCFTLEAEVIECKDKPSMPEGTLGMDAFGRPVSFTDQGTMRRAILAIGRQDIDHEDLIPSEDIEILGSSSDHLIVKDVKSKLMVGDRLTFQLKYGGVLRLMTSPYVTKTYVY